MSASLATDSIRSLSIVSRGPSSVTVGVQPASSKKARAATTLNIWTGYPELVPYYKSVAEAYAKTKPDVTVNLLSSSLREMEQKLSAAIPTGTGPDIFDIGSGIAIKFIQAKLLDNNPPDVDAYLKSGAWNKFTVDWFTQGSGTVGLPLLEGRAQMFWNRAMFKEAGLSAPPKDFGEIMALAGSSRPSVILFRMRNQTPPVVTERLLHTIQHYSAEVADGAFVTIEDFGCRIRRLPLR